MDRPAPVIIGIDQGTTNTKALALAGDGTVLAEVSRPIAASAAEPGWVEQDAEAMIANVIACISELLAATASDAQKIAGIGIANQTETLVVWSRITGRPVMPAIVWQCRRGDAEIAPLRASSSFSLIKSRTGLDLDPTFTAAKLKWIFHNRPDVAEGLRKGDLLFGTVDTWLMWKLSGGAIYASEPSNASRTMLYDIDRLRWDPELFQLFSLDIAHRPLCMRSDAHFGVTERSLFGAPVPITGVMGDQQAALFGLGCFSEFELKVTYGTGAFVWVNAGVSQQPAPAPGIIRTIAWQLDRPCYAYEGFVMYAGKILEWLAQKLAGASDGAAIASAAERAGTSAGVLLVPAFQGLASPWWQADLRAALMGMSEATTADNIAHAGLEAVCYQIRAILDAIGIGRTQRSPMIKVDGGMTRSRYFIQLQADVLQLPLSPAVSGSATPLGAALMAGLGAGIWNTLDDLRPVIGTTGKIHPGKAAAATLDASYGAWRGAIDMLIAQYGRAGTGAG